ncbi:hypothetical protein chiPu_0000044 [Chiloscyllium punctatum]|uniref:Uncharacterized protein n=1 Tax=Chiloscyllium punctatum TaxID=137246 RepID=A0A401RN09_CHIPU|nr:hypothetical protein [Chiloscyllium punctatum]
MATHLQRANRANARITSRTVDPTARSRGMGRARRVFRRMVTVMRDKKPLLDSHLALTLLPDVSHIADIFTGTGEEKLLNHETRRIIAEGCATKT